jgi:hypothetical protein
LRLSGFCRAGLRTSFEELPQARLVKIADWRVPTWLDPFGMLFSQVVVNLLLELGDGVDTVADHQCFKPSLVRGEHNELDKQFGTFVQFKCKETGSQSLHFWKIVLAPSRG